MRIEKNINQEDFSLSNTKFPKLTSYQLYDRQEREFLRDLGSLRVERHFPELCVP